MKFIDIPAVDADLEEVIIARFRALIRLGDFIMGEEVTRLEEEIARYLGGGEAVALSSGTDALLLALKSLDLPQGSEVITTPFTFFATTESIMNAGLKPVYVDIDPATYNMDPRAIEAAITSRTSAILPVHIFGQPARMDQIMPIARKRGLKVVEDCAQAFGAQLVGKHVGAFGDVGCFSFYPTKNLGAYGDAGLAFTHNPAIAEKIRAFRNQGSKIPYRHEVVGVNSRCDAIQAMILRTKLPLIERQNDRRRKNAALYQGGLSDLESIQLPREAADERHVYHQFTVQIPQRDAVRNSLVAADIPTAVYYDIPLHLQEATRGLGYKKGDLPETERAAQRVLSLPIAPHLKGGEIPYIVATIRSQLLVHV